MNNDLQQAEIQTSILGNPNSLNSILQDRLEKLANKWGVSSDDNPYIADIRKSGQHMLMRASLGLARIRNHSPFEEHRAYFEGLMAQDYDAHIYGTAIPQNSPEYLQAKKLLKDLAYFVGNSVISEHEAKQKMAEEIKRTRAWVESGIVPIESGMMVTEIPIGSDKMSEFWGAETLPAELPMDERARLNAEIATFAEIIQKASPFDTAAYLKSTLRPRFVEVLQEIESRKGKYLTDFSFQLQETALIDFKNSLADLIKKGLNKVNPPTLTVKVANAQPYPTLFTAATTAVANSEQAKEPTQEPVKEHPKLQEKLDELSTRINSNIEKMGGKELRSYYEDHLMPKALALKAEIDVLKADGNSPSAISMKEKHMAVIVAGVTAAYNKITEERKQAQKVTLPVLNEAVTLPTPSTRNMTDAVTVPFTEAPSPKKQKSGFFQRHFKAVAASVSTIAVSMVAAFALSSKPAPDVPDAPKASAPTVASVAAPQAKAATIIVAGTPANDTVAEPTAATPVAAAPVATAPVKSVKAAPSKVKGQFAPAADTSYDNVTYNQPLVAKPFDIASSRIGLDTLSRACDFLRGHNATIEGGVCPK